MFSFIVTVVSIIFALDFKLKSIKVSYDLILIHHSKQKKANELLRRESLPGVIVKLDIWVQLWISVPE